MTRFVTENHWTAVRQDLEGRRSSVTAVVSFIGATGDSLMPLRRGDRLVCNADVDTVRLGLTNPTTLQRFKKRGVRIFSVRGLHAKVVVGDEFAWVGSANASDSGFLEALIRVGPTGARPIREWADFLCLEPRELTATAIRNLIDIRSRPIPSVRTPLPPPHDFSHVKKLQLWWMDDVMSPEAEREAQKEVKKSSVSRKEAAFMNSLAYTEVGAHDTSIDEGDWLVPFYGGEPSPPAQVQWITPHTKFKIVWFKHADVSRIPTLDEIEQVVPEWWHENADDNFILRSPSKVQALLDLYS